MTTTPRILRWYIGESVTNMQVVEERLIAVAKGYIEGLHPRYTAQWPLMGGLSLIDLKTICLPR